MTATTVLYICHNHPTVRPGGAENYAHELHLAMDAADDVHSVFLARGGPPVGYSGRQHEGTLIAPVGTADNDYFVFTDGYTYDWLNGSITDKDFYTHHLAKFLAAIRPDVVHVQHANFIGYDLFRLIRNVLPDAAIVYTLHEYSAICHRDGQMLRVRNNEPCTGSSPRRCHECFPDISAQRFFMRRKLIQSHLSVVDHFVSPSRFLIEQYVEWGIPRERMTFEENGRTLPPAVTTAPRPHRDRFAFFGQVSAYKGVDVLLDAFLLLGREEQERSPLFPPARANGHRAPGPEPHLYVHGANLDLQTGELQGRIRSLVEATAGDVSWMGPYRATQMPSLMADVDWVIVPSIWWENSPLVIQEAAHFGRPVICSDIGGMAEKVADDVDGLHFRASDPRHLAEVVRRAATTAGLWDRLNAERPAVRSMADHVDVLRSLYDDVLAARRSRTGAMRVG